MTTIVRNHLAQPVELHFASRTVVASPYADAELSVDEAGSAQVRHLTAAGHVSVHAAEESKGPGESVLSPRTRPAKAGTHGRTRTAKKVKAHSGKD